MVYPVSYVPVPKNGNYQGEEREAAEAWKDGPYALGPLDCFTLRKLARACRSCGYWPESFDRSIWSICRFISSVTGAFSPYFRTAFCSCICKYILLAILGILRKKRAGLQSMPIWLP
jgi:hypothetical protein